MEKTKPELFQISQQIVEETEASMLRAPTRQPIQWLLKRVSFPVGFMRLGPIRWLWQHFIFPVGFMCVGTRELLTPYFKWAFIAIFFIFLTTLAVPEVLATSIKEYVALFFIFAALFLVLFEVPSTYAYYGVTEKGVHEIVNRLIGLGVDSEIKINLLEENLNRISSRVYARVDAFKWLVGAVWALIIFLLNQFTNISLKVMPGKGDLLLSEILRNFAMYIVITLFAIWIILAYKKAADIVFKGIEFACAELKFRIASAEEQTIKRLGNS